MVARSYRDSVFIKKRGHVMGVNVSEVETDDTAPRGRVFWSEDFQLFDSSELVECVACEFSFVVSDTPQADLGQIFGGSAESDCSGDMCCSCFELERRVLVRSVVEVDFTDHLSSTLVGLHLFEKLSFSINYSDPCWSAHLVA